MKPQTAAILAKLQKAGMSGVLNVDLNKICYRYSGRIFELRKLGYQIAKRRVRPEDPGLVLYWLEYPEPIQVGSQVELSV